MYERTLQAAFRYLATTPGASIRIDALWRSVEKEARSGLFDPCPLSAFALLIEGDTRFVVRMEGEEYGDTADDEDETMESAEMRLMGIRASALVELRTTKVKEEEEEIPGIVHRHLSETRHVPSGNKPPPSRRRTKPKSPHHRRKAGL